MIIYPCPSSFGLAISEAILAIGCFIACHKATGYTCSRVVCPHAALKVHVDLESKSKLRSL